MNILKKYQAEKIAQAAVERLAEYIKYYGLKSLVEGISGGVDSAAIAALMERTKKYLAEDGYSIETKYYFLDCESKPFDLERANALANALGFELEYFDLSYVYDLAEHLGVPKIILDSPPGDGLNVTEANAAADQLGLQYESTDYIVSRFLENGFDGTNDKRENGEYVQLSNPVFQMLMRVVSYEIGTTEEAVHNLQDHM